MTAQRFFFLPLVVVLPLVGFAQESKTNPEGVPDAVKGITARELGGHMKFLASDLMKGRDTASPETLLAAEYLADHVEAAGAEPAGEKVDGKLTFFQHFPLESVSVEDEGTTLKLIVDKEGSKRVMSFTPGTDFHVNIPDGSNEEIEAPLVLLGPVLADTDGKNEDYAGMEVRNRIVLVSSNLPGGGQSDHGKRRLNPDELRRSLIKHGALAVVTFRPGPPAPKNAGPANRPAQNRRRGMGGQVRLRQDDGGVPILFAVDTLRDAIFGAAELNPEKFEPKALEDLKLRIRINAKKEIKEDRNVVAIFPGSDSGKKKEVVIFSAHYDHVGLGSDGLIYNGSDDNASGTSALLEIAQAFGQGPHPARSIAFLWVSGEEKGLLGSEWFTDHMTMPEGYKIVADINMDMVSRNDSRSISIHPSSKHSGYNSLVPTAAETCRAEGVEVKYDADQFYGRTDSYNFAKKGIPIVFFFSGLHSDYHQATDDVAKADFEKAARIARASFRLGWLTAQAPEVPKTLGVQAPGDAAR